MSFVRFKRFGRQEYAYEIETFWDSKTKRPKQKTKYLGVVVDKKKKIFEKKLRRKYVEKLILDFGDIFFLNKFFVSSELVGLFELVFGEKLDDLLALISYRLCYPSAMRFASSWFEGSYARLLFKTANLSSQRISSFLKFLGGEQIQKAFFEEYFKRFVNSDEGIIIDASSLPNQIHMSLTTWGRSGEEIDKQIRFLLVVDKKEEMPLFFRYLPGNIVDVSTLKTTINELKKLKIKHSYVFFDAGYFSEDNIIELYDNKIDFLTRLPSIRTLYKELIKENITNLEDYKNVVRYGKRGFFIKQRKINLFGKEAYAYIVLDPQRKGRETNKLLINAVDEKEVIAEELGYKLRTRGIMILVSSFKLKKEDVVPAYYIRQTAEKMFGFSKDDLNILPLRVHNEETLKGFLLLQFISLVTFVQLKKLLGKKHTVEEAMLIMRNLKCKVYDDELLINEPTKQQKKLAEKLNILMPNKLGI